MKIVINPDHRSQPYTEGDLSLLREPEPEFEFNRLAKYNFIGCVMTRTEYPPGDIGCGEMELHLLPELIEITKAGNIEFERTMAQEMEALRNVREEKAELEIREQKLRRRIFKALYPEKKGPFSQSLEYLVSKLIERIK